MRIRLLVGLVEEDKDATAALSSSTYFGCIVVVAA
jgi:hypothetical protein